MINELMNDLYVKRNFFFLWICLYVVYFKNSCYKYIERGKKDVFENIVKGLLVSV